MSEVERIVLRLAGPPTGKDRPRFDPRTGRTYTTKETTRAENDLRAVWREAGEPRLPDDCAVGLSVTLSVPRPASHFRRDHSLSAEGLRHPVPRNKKPDLDNAVKLIMDALNGRCYRDDVQVAWLYVVREWAPFAETLVVLTAIQRSSAVTPRWREASWEEATAA